MPIEFQDILFVAIITLAVCAFIVLLVFLISYFSKLKQRKTDVLEGKEATSTKVNTSGSRLDQVYIVSVYFLIFIIFSILITSSVFAIKQTMTIADNWPLLLVLSLLILGSLVIVDWSKITSRRRMQRELRKT
ncbi:MAG: hypothetical protein ACTSXA_14945 [Candidatus Heimdallarchaeota archaeon]